MAAKAYHVAAKTLQELGLYSMLSSAGQTKETVHTSRLESPWKVGIFSHLTQVNEHSTLLRSPEIRCNRATCSDPFIKILADSTCDLIKRDACTLAGCVKSKPGRWPSAHNWPTFHTLSRFQRSSRLDPWCIRNHPILMKVNYIKA